MGGRRTSRSKVSKDYTMDLPSSAIKNSKAANDSMKKCEQILNLLTAHRFADPFKEPVDPVKLGIPDYPLKVKEPMDLGTVRKKLKAREYKNAAVFDSDIRKIWHNSFLYNPKHTQIYQMTVELNEYFEKLRKELHDGATGDEIIETNNKVRETVNKNKEFSQKLQSKPLQPKQPSIYTDVAMSNEEKKALSEMIKSTFS